jgi:hypothetical protein
MPQLLCILGAVLLLGGVALLRGPPSRPVLVDLGRDLVRPVVLPVLWAGVVKSGTEAGVEEHVARGRLLLRFLPEWTDGHIYFAWQLAFEASRGQKDPDGQLQRLLAAIAYLKQVKTSRPAEVWEAMAYMVLILCKDEDLARAFREHTGKEPAEAVAYYLERAQRYAPSAARSEQRIIVGVSLIAGQLRTGNQSAAMALLTATLEGLDTFRDRQLAADWRAALLDLKSYLEGMAGTSLSDLKKHPQLDEILYVLERR